MFQTDSEEDVIFVSTKCAPKSNELTFDQAKRLALQRDIDQQSQPEQASQRSVAVERMKMKIEGEKSEENNVVKKEKKFKKGQASLPENKNCTVDDGSLAEVKKEKKKGKKIYTIIIEEESWAEGGEKKRKKKRKTVTESQNDANGSDVKDGNDKESSKKKKKKKKQLPDGENQVETAHSSVKEVEKKQRKKVKNKSVEMKPGNVKMEEEEQAGKDKLPKKAKKGKNNLVVSSEETDEKVKEKKMKKKTEEVTTEGVDGISETKKKHKAKTKVAEKKVKLETPEGETGEAEEVKVKKKEVQTIEGGNEVGTPRIKGNNKRSKVEKDDMLNKKKDKSTKREIVIAEAGKTELKKKGPKQKCRKASGEISEAEDTEPKKKKRKKGSSKGEEEELLILKYEDVEEQSRETLVTVVGDTRSKKRERKKSSMKVETLVKNVSFETGAKKKKIKEEVEDQHEAPQVDVVFLSEKTGNADEVTINQERRQALQMEIDKASQPQKAAKPAGFGQWSTAQFDSSDQQQKFLRLMGGFKKGFQPAARSTGGANNMALGKDAQQQLQQGLLGEFERAHSRRVDFSNRGAGLGFAAPANKRFSIDINTCRSVRFDD